jgi:nucleotide-binding universal stress UspA family protein
MTTVLLPFCEDEVSQHAFDLVTPLIRQTNGYLEGLFVLRRPEIMDGDGSMLADAHFTQLIEECRSMAERARLGFEECIAAHGLATAAAGSAAGPAAAWRAIEGAEQQVVGSHGRLFDLIVMARDFGQGWLNWRVIFESALFESGRPVLLVPRGGGATFAENVVIAWNCSTETARTVALAMPLLARARSVTVLSVEGWGVPGPRGKDLALSLERSGIPATARTVPGSQRTAGEVILEECVRSGADLLVKGAYTQSRLRQLMFGGATRYVLANARIPVVMAH